MPSHHTGGGGQEGGGDGEKASVAVTLTVSAPCDSYEGRIVHFNIQRRSNKTCRAYRPIAAAPLTGDDFPSGTYTIGGPVTVHISSPLPPPQNKETFTTAAEPVPAGYECKTDV